MKARRLLGAVALLGALTACTTETTGSPNSANASSSSTSAKTTSAPSTTSSSAAHALPPRPRDLDLSAVNPCTDVLTRDQLHQLAYDLGYQRKPPSGKSGIHQGPQCLYASTNPPDQPSRDFSALISISTSEGASAWLTDPRRKSSADRSRMTTVAEFPALVMPHPSIVDNCTVVVDLHGGQYLEIDGSPGGSARGTSPEPYCTEAQNVAGIVVRNLSARR